MTTDQFWKIIDDARDGDRSEANVALIEETLESLSTDEVLDFERELHRRRAESYRWDLWAIAYIVNGGCSDDGFEYFRGWLIAKGRNYFEAALRDPVRAADDAEPDANECEDILYVAAGIYKDRTGDYPRNLGVEFPKGPIGEGWDEDQLAERYPELCERFS